MYHLIPRHPSNHPPTSIRPRWTLSAAATILAPAIAFGAQTGPVEEIVVQAEFRDLAIDDAAVSVTVVSPEAVRQTVVNHLEEVLGWVPNVNFASGASRGRFLQIRGIGERSQFSEPLNSSVGLLIDGVDMSGIGTAATLFDVSQVEVYRGPQGTLYGANALAGLVNIVSNDPTPQFGGRVQLDAGEYDAYGVGAVLSGPIDDEWGYRLAVRQYQDDGFTDNRFLGRDDTNDHDELTVRAKLSWRPSERARWLLTLGRSDVDNGYDAFSLDNDRNTLSDQPGTDAQQSDYGSLALSLDVRDSLTLEGTVALASSDIVYGYDEDWTFDGFHPFGYSSTDRYARDRDTATVDVRLISKPGHGLMGGRVDWVAGLYALDQSVDLQRTYTFIPDDLFSTFDVRRLAAYGELSLPLADALRLTVGLRGERHDSEYSDSAGVRFDPEDHMAGGRVVLEMDTDDGGLAYLSATRGYKAGGFNTSGTLDADLRQFDPEVLWNFEVGYKTTLADSVSLRAAAFYMMRDDMQVATSTIREIAGTDAVEFISYTGNAAEGTNRGVELEADWQVADAVRLFGSVGWLDTELEDYVNGEGDDLGGREQAQAPKYQFFVGAEFSFARGWFARLELEGKDAYYFSDSHNARSSAYELWNASVGYEGERFYAKLWGRNLGDEDYYVRGFFFGNDPRDDYTPRPFTQLGEPRRLGLSVGMSF